MAANQVGQVEVRVVPDGSQFGPQLQAILDQAAGKAAAAGSTIGQSISRQVAPQVQMVGRSVADMNMQFDNAARKAVAFTGAVMGTKAVVEGMVGKLAGVFDQLAQAQAGFSAILGERKGEALLDEVRQFAKDTPFATKQLVNYSQQLLGVGMASEKIVPLLKDTGNVIASVGGDTSNISRVLYAMSQIQTVGRLMGQDAMQLQSALIPITKLLATYLGKTTQEVKKLQEQGRISAEQVFAAIQAAGQKVPNAMANAVKTIAGAREVLRDSIQILLQDAPALRKIYDDVVKAIQSMAATLSSDEVSGAISRAFEAVGRVYEAIRPTIDAFIESIGEGSMSTLKVFTETLSTFASILNSIPQPVLDLVAKTLATIAILKAPMMLIKYVEQFKRMADIFKGDTMTIQLKKAIEKIAAAEQPTEMLAQRNAQLARSYDNLGQAASGAASKVDAATGKIAGSRPGGALAASRIAGGVSETELVAMFAGQPLGEQLRTFRDYRSQFSGMNRLQAVGQMARNPAVRLGGSVAAMYAGQMVGQGEGASTTMQTVSGALTGASYGMMFGGPWGAAAGAAVGGMMSFFSAQKKAAEKHKKEMEQIGKDTAAGYIKKLDEQFGEGVSLKKLTSVQAEIKRVAGSIAERTSQLMTEYRNSEERRAVVASTVSAWETMNPQPVDSTGARAWAAERANQELAATRQYDYQNLPSDIGSDDQITQMRAEIQALMQEFDPIISDVNDRVMGAFEMLSDEAKKGVVGTLVNAFGSMNEAGQGYAAASIEQMSDGLAEYGLRIQDIVNMSEEELSRVIEVFEGLSDAEQKAARSATTIVTAYEEGSRNAEALWGNRSKALGLEIKALSELRSATDAVTKAYQNQGDEQAQLTAQQAVLNARMTTYSLEYAKVYDYYKNVVGLTDPKAKAAAEEAALKAAAQTVKELTAVSVSSISDMAKTYGYSQDQLKQLIGLQGKIDPNMKITVTVAIDEALKKLQELLNAGAAVYAELRRMGINDGPIYDQNVLRRRGEALDIQAAETRKYLDTLIDRQTGGKTGGGGGQSFADKVKSAADMLKNSIESAMESVKGAAEAWKSTIKDRVQYEAAVSTGRALRNVQRQTADIATLQRGIAQLKSRGLTEEAIKALDINAITDVRQVKRLMSASPEELKRLSSAVAQRDKLASTLAADRQREENRKTITQAILEAAKILGYKFTDAQAKAISAQFNITTETDAKKMVDQILSALSGGKITASMTP